MSPLDPGYFDALMARAEAEDPPVASLLPEPIDWAALFNRTQDVEWLVDDFWPAGRQLHIHAARKTGKRYSCCSSRRHSRPAAARSPGAGRNHAG